MTSDSQNEIDSAADYDWQSFVPAPIKFAAQVFADGAGVILVLTMLITVYDVVARNLGFGSIESVVELTTIGVVMIASFGFAITTIHAGHIVIDLFTRQNKHTTNNLMDGFWLIVTCVLLTAMSVLTIREGLAEAEFGITTEILEWSIMVYHVPPVFGWMLGAGVAFWIGVAVIRSKGEGRSPDVADL